MWESRCRHTNNDDEHVHTTYLLLLGSTEALLLLCVYFCQYYMFLLVHHQYRIEIKKLLCHTFTLDLPCDKPLMPTVVVRGVNSSTRKPGVQI